MTEARSGSRGPGPERGAFDAVVARRSHPQVTVGAPTRPELLRLVNAAAGVADHGSLHPWRLIEVRGAAREVGAGTVSTVGVAVSGQGADFAAFFAPGDLFCAADFTARVLAVTSSAALTLDAAPPVDFTAIGYTRGADPLSYPPVAAVGDVRSASRAFVFGVDFAVRSLFPGSLSGDGLLWLPGGNSPAPGEPYSVLYDYLPRYELTDYGQKAPVVGGQRLLSTAAASLWKPQTHPDL